MVLPVIDIQTPLTQTSPHGVVRVHYAAIDADSDPIDIAVEYSIDYGKTWSTATEYPASSDGTTGLTATPVPGTPHIFAWDSVADGIRHEVCQVRITPSDLSGVGIAETTAPFLVSPNQTPSGFFTNAPTVAEGEIEFTYRLVDPDGDVCSIVVEYSTDNGSTWEEATRAGGDPLTGLLAHPAGASFSFIWDSTDVALGRVKLRITPSDPYEDGTPFESDYLQVDNATAQGYIPASLPDILVVLDPDGFASFFARIIEYERITQSEIIASMTDLFDPDRCPAAYLPYLAEAIGLPLFDGDTESSKRYQIRSAVSVFKKKGLKSAFEELFSSLGYVIDITPVWVNPHDLPAPTFDTGLEDDIAQAPAYSAAPYYPDSQVDVKFIRVDPNASLQPTEIAELLRRFEEVRPIHVTVRDIIAGFQFIDTMPTPTDAPVSTLTLRFYDRADIAFLTCNPPQALHFCFCTPDRRRDGNSGLNRHGTNLNPFTGLIWRRGDNPLAQGTCPPRNGTILRNILSGWNHSDTLQITQIP